MSKINKIKVNGTPYEVEDKEAVKTVTLTQAEYDALQTKDPSIFYVISDGQGGGGGMTSGEVQTMIDASISGKADTSAVTESIATAVSGKQDTLVSGTNIKTINNESILGSGNITISGGGSGSSAVEVTQAEYDALVSGGTLDPSVLYIITDAVGGDLSNYMTSAQTMNAISAATSTKQDILSAGTGIDITDNTISVTGGSGGGKAVSGGTNISITTGETADTINCTLPISAYTASSNKLNLTVFGTQNTISNNLSDANFIVGNYNKVGNGFDASLNNYIFGSNNSLDKGYQNRHSHGNFVAGNYNKLGENLGEAVSTCKIFGNYLNPKNNKEILFGQYNNSVSESTTFGDSGNTLFSVGNGTADNARHNAFEIRQNGDIYITSGSTDIKLQDHLGGGGGGGLDDDTQLLLSTALTDLNDRKADLSEVKQNYQRKGDYATKSELAAKANVSDVMTLEKAKENEQVTSYALNNLNNRVTDNTTALGGMKLVKITESEYTALTTKDENTLYVVIADPE